MLASAVEQCCPVIHQRPGRTQHLAGWTNVEIVFLIVGEVFPAERPIVAGRLVEHRNVRLDRVQNREKASPRSLVKMCGRLGSCSRCNRFSPMASSRSR